MRTKRVVGAGLLGGAMVGLAGLAGAKTAGRKVRRRHTPELDETLTPPTDVTDRTIETADGGSIHLIDTGAGRPVVLMHGVTLQWWVWSATIRLLRPRYRVIAWDMRGHGRSVAGRHGVTLEDAARDLTQVLETLDLHDVILVGHSMGGMVAGRFAAQHHDVLVERVSGLMFLATSAAPVSIKGLAGGLVASAGVAANMGRASLRNPRLAYHWRDTDLSAAMVRLAFGKGATARMVDDVRRMLTEVPSETLAESGAAIADHDVRDEFAAVSVATMVVVGDQDRLTPVGHARVLAELVPGTELRILPGVGHQVMQEAPAELVAAIDQLAARASAKRSASR
ncbi:MAG TPA: alpha/beta hydrolase [Acidimicrobiales bacterium]|jgi:pimeloyl-ACP methyl ester carboxylesterase